ncbi:hypothetical protein ESCO_000341 [Escovopsis weberi]|uniref:Small ribosomal subunit protein mS38 n=1 Tax=Escovopsis weberi TaxID=150374 RepID=A0A0M9VUB6_ESCWE|nr:hypothetical protein ESCO_000341 [Escovopsis weberi]
MLPLSARRALAAPHAAGLAACLAASAPRAAASSVLSSPSPSSRQQQRFSSSKPSRSDSASSNGIPSGQSVSAPAGRGGSRASTGKGKRKSNKDAFDRGAAFDNLPSVPETHHISQEALSLSSFFSLHRPISITQTMPRTVTDEHFASIFSRPSKANKISDAVSTLSNTIDQLEGPMASLTIAGDHADQDGMHRLDVRNPDGSESSIYLQVDAMAGDFFPFRPPPPPQQPGHDGLAPSSSLDPDHPDSAGPDGELEEHAGPRPRSVYKALFTIEETTDPDGRIRIVAHSARVINDGQALRQPRSFLERLALRQARFDEVRSRRVLYAISVKRQRRLRMKKKKYKKLMKRTRNLRRKLDRT